MERILSVPEPSPASAVNSSALPCISGVPSVIHHFVGSGGSPSSPVKKSSTGVQKLFELEQLELKLKLLELKLELLLELELELELLELELLELELLELELLELELELIELELELLELEL